MIIAVLDKVGFYQFAAGLENVVLKNLVSLSFFRFIKNLKSLKIKILIFNFLLFLIRKLKFLNQKMKNLLKSENEKLIFDVLKVVYSLQTASMKHVTRIQRRVHGC